VVVSDHNISGYDRHLQKWFIVAVKSSYLVNQWLETSSMTKPEERLSSSEEATGELAVHLILPAQMKTQGRAEALEEKGFLLEVGSDWNEGWKFRCRPSAHRKSAFSNRQSAMPGGRLLT
jgi:hypothetical protein